MVRVTSVHKPMSSGGGFVVGRNAPRKLRAALLHAAMTAHGEQATHTVQYVANRLDICRENTTVGMRDIPVCRRG